MSARTAANACNTTRSSKLFARSVNPCGPASLSPSTASSTVPRSSPITAAPFLAASMATTARSSSSR